MVFQNLIAAAVFFAFLVVEATSYLLYLHPDSLLLWKASLEFGRYFQPVLEIINGYVRGGIVANLAILAGLTALPIFVCLKKGSYRRMASALNSHLALGSFSFCLYVSILQQNPGSRLASINPIDIVLTHSFEFKHMFAAILFLALVAGCIDCHRSFFRA